MEKNNSHCGFFQAYLSLYQQPRHKAKVKVQPLLCSFPPSSTLPVWGWWSHAWTLSPWMWVHLQPSCYHSLRFTHFPRKQQLLLLHSRWCSEQLSPIACLQRDGSFEKLHLISLLLPRYGAVGGEVAGKAGAEENQLLTGLGEAEQGCPDAIPPAPALGLVPALMICTRCAQ